MSPAHAGDFYDLENPMSTHETITCFLTDTHSSIREKITLPIKALDNRKKRWHLSTTMPYRDSCTLPGKYKTISRGNG